MKNIFKDILKGKVVVCGIGNTMKADDAFGPMLIERISDVDKLTCIDAGSAPENYAGKIIKESPDTLLLVDAVHLDESPGHYELLKKDDILKSGFTTHEMSPAMFIEYLESETKAEIFLLGVQPLTVDFGEDMSKEVNSTLEKIEIMIREAVNA